jgi:hypothetical protein
MLGSVVQVHLSPPRHKKTPAEAGVFYLVRVARGDYFSALKSCVSIHSAKIVTITMEPHAARSATNAIFSLLPSGLIKTPTKILALS